MYVCGGSLVFDRYVIIVVYCVEGYDFMIYEFIYKVIYLIFSLVFVVIESMRICYKLNRYERSRYCLFNKCLKIKVVGEIICLKFWK